MRIVSWNCRGDFDRKAAAFLELRPDIGIVPESNRHPRIAEGDFFNVRVPHLWTGDEGLPTKGLGVFAPGAESVTAIEPEQETLGRHGLGCSVVRERVETGVVGVWTLDELGGVDPYARSARAIVGRYGKWLSSGRTLLAGDFNLSGQSGLGEIVAFASWLREETGLVSAYHAFHGVEFGKEREQTLWWMFDRTKGFHCDFVFVPAAWTIREVSVGGYEQWGSVDAPARSDHAPVIVDVDICG